MAIPEGPLRNKERKYLSVARQGLEMEALGLGEAGQGIQGMAAMAKTGVEDPARTMRDAVQQAFMSGIRDSREFQGLLEATEATAEHTMSYSGAMSTLMGLMQTGLPGSGKIAGAALGTLQERMSGSTGTYMDMMKFQSAVGAGRKASERAEKAGEKLTSEDVRDIEWFYQNKDITQLTPGEAKKMLSPQAYKYSEPDIKAKQREIVSKGMYVPTEMSIQDQETFGPAAEAIQSSDKEQVKKLLGTKKQRDEFARLQRLYSPAKDQAKTEGFIGQGLDWMEESGVQLEPGERKTNRMTEDEAKNAISIGGKPSSMADLLAQAKAMPGAAGVNYLKKQNAPYIQEEGPLAPVKAFDALKKQLSGVGTEEEQMRQLDLGRAGTKVAPTKEIPKDMKIESLSSVLERLSKSIGDLQKSMSDPTLAKEINVNSGGNITVNGTTSVTGVVVKAAADAAATAIANPTSNAPSTPASGAQPGPAVH